MATFSAIYSIINKNNLINLKIDGRCLICGLKIINSVKIILHWGKTNIHREQGRYLQFSQNMAIFFVTKHETLF